MVIPTSAPIGRQDLAMERPRAVYPYGPTGRNQHVNLAGRFRYQLIEVGRRLGAQPGAVPADQDPRPRMASQVETVGAVR